MESWRERADAALEAENFEEALAAFERALAEDSDDVDALFGKALSLTQLDRQADALALLRPLTQSPETAPRAWGLVVGIHHSAQNVEEEIRALQEARHAVVDPDDFAGIGDAYDNLGLWADAVQAFDKAVEGYDAADDAQGAAAATFSKAFSLTNAGLNREAIEALQSRPPADDLIAHWQILLARSFNDLGEPDRALEALEGGPDSYPEELGASNILQRAIAFNSLGRFDDALASLAQAEGMPAPEKLAHSLSLQRALALNATGRYPEALAVLDEPPEQVPAELRWEWRVFTAGALNELGRFGEAIAATEGEPWPEEGEVRGWLLLARAASLNGSGEYQDALAAAEEAETFLAPEARQGAALAKATAYNGLGRPEEVLEVLAEPLPRIGPDHGLMWFIRSIALNRLGRHEEALAAVEVAAGLLPPQLHEGVLLQRVWALVGLQRPADALTALPDPLPRDLPQQGALWLLQGRAFNQMERNEDALSSLGVAATLMGPTVGLLTERAVALAQTGKSEEALKDLQDAAQLDPSIDENVAFLHLRLNLLLRARLDAEAEGVLAKLAELDSESRPLWVALRASNLLTRNEIRPALTFAADVAKEAQETAPANALAWIGVALAQMTLGDAAAADTALASAANLDSEVLTNRLFRLVAAMAAVRSGESSAVGLTADEVIDTFLEFESAATGSFGAILAGLRGLALVKADRKEDALQAFAESLERVEPDPVGVSTSVLVWTQRGTLALNDRRLEEADDAFDHAIEASVLMPEDHPGRIAALLGDATRHLVRQAAAGEKSDAAGARTEGERALARSAEAARVAETLPIKDLYSVARLLQATALGSLERPEEGLAVLRRAQEGDPHNVDVLLLVGATCLNLEDYEDARSAFVRAAEVAVAIDDRCGAALGEGDAETALGSYEFALRAYRRAVDLRPEWPGVWRCMGALYEDMERHEAACFAYRRAWQLTRGSSGSVEAAIGLSAALIGAGRHGEALTFIQQSASAGRAAPDPRLAFNRGVALLKKGDEPAAARAFEEAARAGLEAAEEPAKALRRGKAGDRSWVEFWFGSEQSGWRKALGSLLVALLFGLLVILFVEPGSLPGMDWLRVSGDWPRALAPLVVVGLLLILPSLERFSFGQLAVETSPWKPEAADIPLPSVDDLVRLVRTIAVSKLTVTPGAVANSPGGELPPPPLPLPNM
ncbi:MAG: tetratricopeptide repeat protein [Actinomycetota bacterium]